jgi:hypothetical protein
MSFTADGWILVASAAARRSLAPLIEAHAAKRPVRIFAEGEDWRDALDDAAGVLIVSERRRAPRNALPGLFLTSASGRRVPAGSLPQGNSATLAQYAMAAAGVHRRRPGPIPIALLAQWDDEALRTTARAAALLQDSENVRLFQWTADRIVRRDLLTAFRCGPGLALYFGHGRPYGWCGYHGLHIRHLRHARGEALAAVVSLTCNTAARTWGGRYSFAERLALSGIAAAAVGAIEPTRTPSNWRWGVGLCRELACNPHRPIGELLLRSGASLSHDWVGGDSYRIIGDPLTPLVGASSALSACRQVYAPAPEEIIRRLSTAA